MEIKEGCGFWIYPGERRPVVVFAKTKEEAIQKITRSGHYDGFPLQINGVFTVEEFAKMCEGNKKK